MAADLNVAPSYVPPLAPTYAQASVYNWSGLYLGVLGGYDWNGGSSVSGGSTYRANLNGGIAGIYGGYNWQLNTNWVFGVDTSFNYDWATGSATSGGPLPNANRAGPNWKGFIRGRVGYAWDRFMLYGTAGGAMMGYTASTRGPIGVGRATPIGWTIGGGIETALGNHWVTRLDYAYQNYGTFTLAGIGAVKGTSVSVASNTLTLGVAYKF